MNVTEFEHHVAANLPPKMAGGRLVVAVSGGADSVCLLRVLHALRETISLELVAAHFNHGWRGAESAADAAFVHELCQALAIPAFSRDSEALRRGALCSGGDGALFSEDSESRLNVGHVSEESARDARYEFLRQVATEQHCRFVAVGHTADDQVETLLHHILRGTGLAGLRGMPLDREFGESRLIRPLLTVRRSDAEAYLAAIGQPFRTDATNADERFTRNRIRHVLLPLLREQFNPQVDDALLRLGEQAQDAARVLHDVAGRLLEESLLELSPTVCRLRREPLRDADAELVRIALTLLWQRAGWSRQKMTRDDWCRAAELACVEAAVTLPGGVQARSRGGVLEFRREFDGG